MSFIIALLSRLIYYLIWAVELAILARIVFDFIMPEDDSPVIAVLYYITEPILLPCRMLLDKLGFGEGLLDFSPLLASMVLYGVMVFLPSV